MFEEVKEYFMISGVKAADKSRKLEHLWNKSFILGVGYVIVNG